MKLYSVGAKWCSGCAVQKALLKNLNVFDKFEYVDIDENMEFATKYGIRSIPQLLLVDDDGVLVKSFGSTASKETILSMVNDASVG